MPNMMDEHSKLTIRHAMGIRREAFLDHMTFVANESPVFGELFGPMIGVKDDWQKEGATAAELDFSAFRYREPLFHHLPLNTGFAGRGVEPELVEETAEHWIWVDELGRRMKLMKGVATLPLPLNFPVRTMTDWLAIKHHFTFTPERLAAEWVAKARQAAADGYVVRAGIPGAYWTLRDLMGDEETSIGVYTQPELLHDILATLADTAFRVLEEASRQVVIDELSVAEDIAGKSGPLWGPLHIDEFIRPYYRRIWDMLASRGTRLFRIDSDGDIRPIIPNLLAAGINVISPCEPAAGMDVVQLRRQYGNALGIEGGIDKHALWKDRAAIDAELARVIPPMIRSPGTLLSLDHRIPNGVSLDNYRYYIQRAWDWFGR